jgi:hypothetical protein
MLDIVALIVAVVVLVVVVLHQTPFRARRARRYRRRHHLPYPRPVRAAAVQQADALLGELRDELDDLRVELDKTGRKLHDRRVICDEQVTIIHGLRRELGASRLAHSASVGVQRQLAAALVCLEEEYRPLAAADRPGYEELWREVRREYMAVDFVLDHPEDYRAPDRTA